MIGSLQCPFDYCDFKNTQSSETHLKMHIFCTHGLQKKYFYEEMKYRKEFELKTFIKTEQTLLPISGFVLEEKVPAKRSKGEQNFFPVSTSQSAISILLEIWSNN